MRRILRLSAGFSLLLLQAGGPVCAAKATRTVKACSAYGNGCMAAPVRASPLGPQVRLKSGTWIYCRGDCRDTLREDVLDFWETQQEKALIVR